MLDADQHGARIPGHDDAGDFLSGRAGQVPPDLAGSRVGPNFDPAGDQAELVSCIERLEWVGDSGVKKRVLGGHGQAKLAMTYST